MSAVLGLGDARAAAPGGRMAAAPAVAVCRWVASQYALVRRGDEPRRTISSRPASMDCFAHHSLRVQLSDLRYRKYTFNRNWCGDKLLIASIGVNKTFIAGKNN